MKELSVEQIQKRKNRVLQNKLRSYNKYKSKLESKPEYVINKNLQKIRVSNRKFLKGFSGNRLDAHERLKFESAFYCIKKGWDVILEAIFEEGGGIADIYIPFMDIVIEILDSEKPQNCIDKVQKYPVSQVIMLETKKGIKFNLNYLEKIL